MTPQRPLIVPLGDQALLLRFGETLDDAANCAALDFARRIMDDPPAGVLEIVPSLVSVVVHYDAKVVDFRRLSGEMALLVRGMAAAAPAPLQHRVAVRFGGEHGPDLGAVAAALQLSDAAFVAAHNAGPLRVLATGFAPGFVYCGFHGESLRLPRRPTVRREVPAGSVLFAAGQTAIAATPIPTGWSVIGRTGFRNFDAARDPPTILAPGDAIVFEPAR